MYTQYYYKEESDGTVCLLRCLGESREVIVPEFIGGKKVTGIGAYCFSQNGHLEKTEYMKTAAPEEEGFTADAVMTEQAGKYIVSVSLPASITEIGAYAFYNCRSLTKIELPGSIRQVGNDAFMNCTSLRRLYLHAAVIEKSILPFLLIQITWNVETFFLRDDDSVEALVFFPEYLEYYDEIGPAHVFELYVEGEGYRARKCFVNGIFSFPEYDAIFSKASAEESVQTVCRMIFARLRYPIDLSEDCRQNYADYLKAHAEAFACLLFEEKEESMKSKLDHLLYFLEQGWLTQAALDLLIQKAAEEEMAEASATFIQWKRRFFSVKKKKRYEF